MKLRNYLMAGGAVATLVGATTTAANAAQAYASIFGGASFLENTKVHGSSYTAYPGGSYTLLSQSTQSADMSFKTGYVVGGNFGIDWQSGLRTEVEFAYRGASSDKVHLKTSYFYGLNYGGNKYTYATGTTNKDVPGSVNMRAYSLMANAWYDFDIGSTITPYVGGGAGMALVQLDGTLNGFKLHEKNDTVFAWQVGAGASMPIDDSIKAFIDYRYFSAGNAKLKLEPGFHGGDVKADLNAHTVMVGLRFAL